MTPAELTLQTKTCQVHRTAPEPACVTCVLTAELRRLAAGPDLRGVPARALALYGVGPQLGQTAEECAELIVAANHYMRGRATTDKLAEEAADVELMLAQVKEIVGADAVARWREAKLKRFEERLAAQEKNV